METVSPKSPSKEEVPASWERSALQELARPARVGENDELSGEDLSYVKDARFLIRRRVAGGFRGWLPWLCLALVGGLVWWASWAEIEEVTRGVGKVIPSQSVQLIQSLEGGLVEEIYVKEGQVVEKDQPLLRIRDAIFASSYNENLAKRDTLEARLCRLAAESQGFTELTFPDSVRPDLAELERKLYEKRKQDYVTTKQSLEARLKLAREEERLLKDGTKSRAVSAVELIRASQEVQQLDGQSQTLDTSTQRDAMEHYHQDKADLDSLVQALKRDKDRLDRTLIRAPVRGTVNKIYINTVGRVIGSAVDIMDIVPTDDTLLIEANVRPADIAFIRPGQPAMVKFTAYDFAIYGGLKGTLERISVDTISADKNRTKSDNKNENRDESFYQIKVRTAKNSLGKDRQGKELEIIPGMVAEVDVLTGKKTVLTYLLKPINRAKMRAFRER
ncbi:type I secretion membrane fusion protein, HlyD family [Chthoniobacter flavus Ellin428]|uniref:Type I secretion membrane fusion protein, HlyD family n=1 Tax=Chthoniobacter flavus Ellin428 TaxID=497964 RepID=B4DAX6_9BACT|nr:HlyD family type I secretion periplasmic adaptor subunit [Chthoniobacter flavus]EDY16448.1 type I secretion membrane fusion protein, HlyD family [Chthoniobacter flavus Ellin428]TCO84539.1 adhesin transport system membrane fusion protein [Chthoniobacter flavus]